MARLLVVTIALMLALPASTMAQDQEWPTAYEVRRELQSIGYEFGSDGLAWEGGRESTLQATFADDPQPAIRLLEGDAGLTMRFFIPTDHFARTWPSSTLWSGTAFMEVLDILSVEQAIRNELGWHLRSDADGCWVRPLPDGGIVRMVRSRPTGPWLVIIAEGRDGVSLCDGPRTIGTDAPEPRPTPTAKPRPSPRSPVATMADLDGEAAADGGEPGVAVLTIGDESWTFDSIFCAMSPEAAGNDRISFTLSVLDRIDDTRVQLDATIQDPDEQGRLEGEGVIYSVTLTDIEDFEDPSIAWSAPSPFVQLDAPLISVDGKQVTAEGPFDDERTEESEAVPGTLTATCP